MGEITTASGPTLTTNASINEVELYARAETRRECYERLSNERADEAMHWALHGKLITMERCAELADVYALIRSVIEELNSHV